MKFKFIIIVILTFLTNSLIAQNFIPFQGIALDGTGKSIPSQKISLRLTILKDNSSGSVSYSEIHAPTTDRNGLFQVNIGAGTVISNSFSNIDWSTMNYFLKVEMDLGGGSNYTLVSNTKFGTVPYAFFSNNSKKTIVYQNIGNVADTLQLEDNVDIVETSDGNWRHSFKLPKPTQTNLLLSERKNTTILINCRSSFSINILNTNTNLRENLNLNNGEYAIFLFDGEKWLNTGGKPTYIDSKNNTSIGFFSLTKNTLGSNNTTLGYYALKENITGSNNISIGPNSLSSNKASNANLAIGSVSLNLHTSGDGNIAIGHNSMYKDENSSETIAIGYNSLYNLKSGLNTALGTRTLFQNVNGYYNTAIGDGAGSLITGGTNNIFIGHNSQGSSTNASNEITLGDANIRVIRSAVTSITSLSDARDKKNIQDLSIGLNFLQSLKPRSFQWDKREWYNGNQSDGSKISKSISAGFIAQELDESQQKFNVEWLNLVYKSNPEKLEANYGNLIPILVKSVQELLENQNYLQKRIEQLEKQLNN